MVSEVDDGGQSEGCSGQERLISNQESIQLMKKMLTMSEIQKYNLSISIMLLNDSTNGY